MSKMWIMWIKCVKCGKNFYLFCLLCVFLGGNGVFLLVFGMPLHFGGVGIYTSEGLCSCAFTPSRGFAERKFFPGAAAKRSA